MKTIFLWTLSLLLFSLARPINHALVGKWQLERMVVKNKMVFLLGCKDSTEKLFSEIFFETQEAKLAAIDKTYEEMANISLHIKSKKAKQSGKSNQWVKYEWHDSILEISLNKAKVEYIYHFNEDLTHLELIADSVVTTFSRME